MTIEAKLMREGFGEELLALGEDNEKIVVLSGDLEDSTKAEYFKKKFKDRFFNLGIAEQDIVGTAAGLGTLGFIPFACSFAVFLTNRAYDMIRIDICYNKINVKLVGTHTGVNVGEDGPSAQSLEDIAIMRVLPNMTVLTPADYIETKKATRAMAEYDGPVYMRLGRSAFPIISKEQDEYKIGKANVLREGDNITIIACGLMVYESLQAADLLKKEGINAEVINMHTIKPIDENAIINSAKKTGAIVTAEEHQIYGGLGSAVAEVLSDKAPTSVEMVAIRDTFCASGSSQALIERYKLKDVDIAQAAKKAIKKKK